jgi:hypothetical protein
LLKQFCSNGSSLQDDVSNLEHLRATCFGFPSVAEQVAHTVNIKVENICYFLFDSSFLMTWIRKPRKVVGHSNIVFGFLIFLFLVYFSVDRPP